MRGSWDDTEEDVEKRRAKSLMRSGIILNDPDVIDAMERGDKMRYIPVKFTKEGAPSGESLVTLEEMGVLAGHIDKTLLKIASEMRGGEISADPYFRTETDNACLYCDYFEACHFEPEGREDRMRRLTRLKPGEAIEKMRGEVRDR